MGRKHVGSEEEDRKLYGPTFIACDQDKKRLMVRVHLGHDRMALLDHDQLTQVIDMLCLHHERLRERMLLQLVNKEALPAKVSNY